MTKHTIDMDLPTQRFFQGVSAASQVNEAHADLDFPDHETQAKMFWFYVGVLAAGEHGCESQEDFTPFTLGANTRAPQESDL